MHFNMIILKLRGNIVTVGGYLESPAMAAKIQRQKLLGYRTSPKVKSPKSRQSFFAVFHIASEAMSLPDFAKKLNASVQL